MEVIYVKLREGVMKSTVIKIFSLLFVLAFVVSCNSQDSQFGNGDRGRGNRGQGNFDPEAMAKRQVDRLTETLDLSEDQKEQATELYKKIGEKQADLRTEAGGDREKMREKRWWR